MGFIRISYGGILLVNNHRTIILKNTLDIRVELVYHESLPEIRKNLFG